VVGMEGEIITMQDVFSFKQTGIGEDGRALGRVLPTGIRPKFVDQLADLGLGIPPEVFATKEEKAA